jgi:hypothetical protein
MSPTHFTPLPPEGLAQFWLESRFTTFSITGNGSVSAGIRALNNGTTGFRMWDALERRTAATQIGTLNRWNKGEQTA